MGYLNNSTVTVDAILTKKGRELLARGDGSFSITQFALADDEIDYSLYNVENPSGSAFFGEEIEKLPLLEAFPDEQQTMKYKLVTLPRGSSTLPTLTVANASIKLKRGESAVISPKTFNFRGVADVVEGSGYIATLGDVRLSSDFTAAGVTAPEVDELQRRENFETNVSRSLIGTSFTLTATQVNTAKKTTTLTIEGRDSGARLVIPVEIKAITATNSNC